MTDRKAEILEAAKEEFARKGVKHTTVRQIGARAGILSGSLYHHFESKLDIVDRVLTDFCGEVLAEYDRIEREHHEPTERLRAMAHYAFSLIERHSAAVLIMQNDSDELVADPRFAYLVAFNDSVERHWMTAIAQGVAEGRLRAGTDASTTYRFARDAILGAVRWYEPSKPKSLDQLADELADMLLFGLAVPGRRPRSKR
jgi:AcrR family transcriptional regulator